MKVIEQLQDKDLVAQFNADDFVKIDDGYQGLEKVYKPLPGDYYDKYEDCIEPTILRSRSYTTEQLDRMCEQNSKGFFEKNKFEIFIGLGIIIFLIVLLGIKPRSAN
jgi:hypothetical protein